MQPKRTKVLKVRLTDEEFSKLPQPLTTNGKSQRGLSRLVRDALFSTSRRPYHSDCKHCRLLAMAVNNLNVIARRCETVPNPETTVQVLAQLASLERAIRELANTSAL